VEIIPVIDLLGGIVVQAKAGQREQYLPLESLLTDSVELLSVVSDLLAFYRFNTVYIADLDAIAGDDSSLDDIALLIKQYPDISFWLDAGIRNIDDLNRVIKLGFVPVVGSESLETLAVLQTDKKIVLSLDRKIELQLGLSALWETPALWPEQIIAMDLDYVGMGKGPSYDLIEQIQSEKPGVSIVAAGGVRAEKDLIQLASRGVKQVLVGSAIHSGMLTREVIQDITPLGSAG